MRSLSPTADVHDEYSIDMPTEIIDTSRPKLSSNICGKSPSDSSRPPSTSDRPHSVHLRPPRSWKLKMSKIRTRGKISINGSRDSPEVPISIRYGAA